MATLEEANGAKSGGITQAGDARGSGDASPYHVHLPSFDGPLDLLLHLIERRQMEITTISLVAVTDQFIEYVRNWPDEEPPMARLAEFITIGAKLLFIKSRSLLPQPAREEDISEANEAMAEAEELRRHLLEYKLAKEIAKLLREREAAGLMSFPRPGPISPPADQVTWARPKLVGLEVEALAAAFRRVLEERRRAQPEPLPLPVVRVSDKIAEIEAGLAAHGRVQFEELLRLAESRLEVVVTFLAVLELWHQERILVAQEGLFAPILLLPVARPPASDASTSESPPSDSSLQRKDAGESPPESLPQDGADPSTAPDEC
ncbi:MAG TPA: segregation/condensation protein A [Ktedonobacterales bacterium]|jgi:segregation and condensation protein A